MSEIDIKVTMPLSQLSVAGTQRFLQRTATAIQKHLGPLNVENALITIKENDCIISFVLNGYSQQIRMWISNTNVDTALYEYVRSLSEQP